MLASAAISTLYKPAGGKSYTVNEQTIQLMYKSLPASVMKPTGAGNFRKSGCQVGGMVAGVCLDNAESAAIRRFHCLVFSVREGGVPAMTPLQ